MTLAAITLYVYFLGPWAIGPFTDLKGCESARSYQLRAGAAELAQISQCLPVND